MVYTHTNIYIYIYIYTHIHTYRWIDGIDIVFILKEQLKSWLFRLCHIHIYIYIYIYIWYNIHTQIYIHTYIHTGGLRVLTMVFMLKEQLKAWLFRLSRTTLTGSRFSTASSASLRLCRDLCVCVCVCVYVCRYVYMYMCVCVCDVCICVCVVC